MASAACLDAPEDLRWIASAWYEIREYGFAA